MQFQRFIIYYTDPNLKVKKLGMPVQPACARFKMVTNFIHNITHEDDDLVLLQGNTECRFKVFTSVYF